MKDLDPSRLKPDHHALADLVRRVESLDGADPRIALRALDVIWNETRAKSEALMFQYGPTMIMDLMVASIWFMEKRRKFEEGAERDGRRREEGTHSSVR